MKIISSLVMLLLCSQFVFAHCGGCGVGDFKAKKVDQKQQTEKLKSSCCSLKKNDSKKITVEPKLTKKTQKRFDKLTNDYQKKVSQLNHDYCDDVKNVLSDDQYTLFLADNHQCDH
tara:strand:- start:1777 stop:2124 length:348 start_codon:yes stop_codon:yes gene_type:complete